MNKQKNKKVIWRVEFPYYDRVVNIYEDIPPNEAALAAVDEAWCGWLYECANDFPISVKVVEVDICDYMTSTTVNYEIDLEIMPNFNIIKKEIR